MFHRYLITLSFACLVLAGCAQPIKARIKSGRYHFIHQNYGLAIEQLKTPAKKGDAASQYAVGYMYFYGLGTPVDKELGLRWIKQAAQQHYPKAEIAYHEILYPKKDTLSLPPLRKKPKTQAQHQKLFETHQRLLAIPPHFYTVQLMGDYRLQRVLNAAKHYNLPLFDCYQTKHHGQPWYNLIYGIYPTREQATKAMAKLPRRIQRLKPWVKPLRVVQREIRS